VLTFLFFLFRLMPGDFASLMMRQGASDAAVASFRERWGLDDPLYVQYWRYLVNFLQLDMGTSLQFRKPVWDYVAPKIFNTFILVAPSITFGYIIASVIGTVMGSNRGSKFEKYGVIALITTGAFPGFFVAILAIIAFGVHLNLVPTGSMFGVENIDRFADAPWWRPYLTVDFAAHYILPFSVIVVRYLFGPSLVMRTSVIEVMDQDFVYYQRVSGLPSLRRLRHLAKHSILPVVTLYPVSMTRALSGLVLIELVFNWPGIGFALIQAVYSRDTPVVMFVFFITAAFVIIANFVVDILYGVIDPRVSVGERE